MVRILLITAQGGAVDAAATVRHAIGYSRAPLQLGRHPIPSSTWAWHGQQCRAKPLDLASGVMHQRAGLFSQSDNDVHVVLNGCNSGPPRLAVERSARLWRSNLGDS
jgi:hypothetical protein